MEISNLIGVLRLEGIEEVFPVMFIPGDNEYYLTHNLYGDESISGAPYLCGACFPGCRNALIYGHHMADGSQFAGLDPFYEKNFCETQPHATLTLKNGDEIRYQFIASCEMDLEEDFPYYKFTDLRDPEVLKAYVSQMVDHAIYSMSPTDTDCLTLSTCSPYYKNKRLVILFQKI